MNNVLQQLSVLLQQNAIKGFLHEDEAECLYRYATQASRLGPCLEVGSYCGKSTVYLGAAYAKAGTPVYAVDHHRGSEEHQPGEEYHDAELFNTHYQLFDSFPAFRNTLKVFGLEQTVIPVVAASETVVAGWQAPLAMVFIDGGHSDASARHDCLQWGAKVIRGGILAIHDIYMTEAEGGQAPRNALNALLEQGEFQLERKVGSLVVLRCVKP